MDNFLEAIGWSAPATDMMLRGGSRLLAAVVLGGIVGLERESRQRAAGLRTHMMVALGSALFTLVPMEAGATASDLAQIVKGIAAGIGFLGAGAILKLTDEREIRGLTTASSIWLTAAVGLAVGAGWIGLASVAILLSVAILVLVGRLERRWNAEPSKMPKS